MERDYHVHQPLVPCCAEFTGREAFLLYNLNSYHCSAVSSWQVLNGEHLVTIFLSLFHFFARRTETSPLTLTPLLSSVCGARAGSTGFSSLDASFFDNCSQELGPRIFIPHVSLFHFLGRSDGRINSLSFPRRLVLVLPSQVWELRPPPCSGHLSWPRPSQTAWPGHTSLCFRFPLAGCG